jgi:ion channel-forming bestrophin family protein
LSTPLRRNPSFFYQLIALRGSVVPAVLPYIIGFAALTAALVAASDRGVVVPQTSFAPFAIFGVALSLFLGFRNFAAYERWWEARKVWGGVIGQVRSIDRDTTLFLAAAADRLAVQTHVHGFIDEIAAIGRVPLSPHRPALGRCAAYLHECAERQQLSEFGLRAFSDRLHHLEHAKAGLQRLQNTPLPFVYSLLVKRTCTLFCLLLPFATIDIAGWFAPVIVAVAAYVFFGLARVTEVLEFPLEPGMNALDIDGFVAICKQPFDGLKAEEAATQAGIAA